MTTSRKTQSALRAALKNEDAALAQRLPDTEKTTKPVAAKPVAAKPVAAKPVAAKPAPASASAPDAPATSGKAAAVRKPARPKPVTRRTPKNAQAKVVKPAPVTPDVAVTPPATSAATDSVQIRPLSPAKPEKRLRETFSLGRSDIDRLAALKARGAKNGSKYGRSALLRAGLLLLEAQDETNVSALIEQLPAFKKGKRKKK